MSKYWIAPTDYGVGNNDTYPRWRVYTWNRRREPWGHIGNHSVSQAFWTPEEAHEELDRLERNDLDAEDAFYKALAISLVVIAGVVALYLAWVW